MRTTMNLPDGLLEQVRERARASGRTTTSVVEEALRAMLDQEQPQRTRRPMPVWGTPGSPVLVDLHDYDAVWDALEDRS